MRWVNSDWPGRLGSCLTCGEKANQQSSGSGNGQPWMRALRLQAL
jgi:hypothetical protein